MCRYRGRLRKHHPLLLPDPAMDEPEALFTEYLARKRLKMTSQRKAILKVFLYAPGHLSSEELYHKVMQADASVGQATVYRTMKLLSDSGLAREVRFGDGVCRYEIRYGHEHHDHLICEQCGVNLEVVDHRIEALQDELAKKHGYVLTGHRMYLYGLCPGCREGQKG